MQMVWLDTVIGLLWGFWLAMYLDRFYAKQVTAVHLCVFVFVQKSFKTNRALGSFINLSVLCLFLMAASALIGHFVESWGLFVLGWILGYGIYLLRFSQPKPDVQRRV
ncbi:hypothetical protein L4D06_16670 [Enterovibrio makurazakiensis]|uniref:Permease n=1 Tax=Enterovibrio gelatinilyticus TaxID=2899819 RepID=A0ABT5R408_9GAMM|nr:hypothetical protein [Enterovibrio sp. ZSDZ42]MDD1794247.1 hypothetical protein [Enterovibrio sp. ZSDZ42]